MHHNNPETLFPGNYGQVPETERAIAAEAEAEGKSIAETEEAELPIFPELQQHPKPAEKIKETRFR